MKYFLSISTLLLLTISCSQDFDLTADYEETTIVYGLVSSQDSVHYLRIHRGYIDSASSALKIARDPDSIYYGPQLEVEIFDSSENQWLEWERVDGKEIGLPKDSGLFARDPNILFRLKEKLDKDQDYQLRVFNPKTGNKVTASTHMLSNFTIHVPTDNYIINWKGDKKEKVNFAWNHAEGAGIYDMQMTFWYTDHYKSGKAEQQHISWKVFTNMLELRQQDNALLGYGYRTILFYQNIAGRIDPDTNVFYRQADSVTFLMAGGGEELAELISNQKVRNGILSGMATPYYTNIEGGYGIFSSVFRDTISTQLGGTAYDSLRYGSLTRHLKFN